MSDVYFELHDKGTFNSFNGLNTVALHVVTGYELFSKRQVLAQWCHFMNLSDSKLRSKGKNSMFKAVH